MSKKIINKIDSSLIKKYYFISLFKEGLAAVRLNDKYEL